MSMRSCGLVRSIGHGAALAFVLTATALAVAACGSGPSASVASLNSSTTTTTATTIPSSSGNSGPAQSGAGNSGQHAAQASLGGVTVQFAQCMRTHGVPSFPDPDAQGTITIMVSPSLDPSSPLFQRAEADCQHLAPAGKGPSQAQQQRMKAGALAFAACMRSHGVPGYPDPTFASGGGISQKISRSEVDPSSPIFQAAQKGCQRKRAPS